MIYWQTSDSKTKSSPSPGVVAAQIQSHSPAPRRCLSIQKPPGTLPHCQTHQPGNFMDHPFHLNKNIVIQCSYKDSQLIISHFQTITSKNLQKTHIYHFFSKHFFWGKSSTTSSGETLCLGHVLAGDAHALRPAAGAEARLLQALRHLAMRRCGEKLMMDRCENSHATWNFMKFPSIHLVVYASYNTYYIYIRIYIREGKMMYPTDWLYGLTT